MSHVLSLLLADRKLVSFPTRSFDSIEPEGCSDNLARMDYVALSIVTPKAIISAATSSRAPSSLLAVYTVNQTFVCDWL